MRSPGNTGPFPPQNRRRPGDMAPGGTTKTTYGSDGTVKTVMPREPMRLADPDEFWKMMMRLQQPAAPQSGLLQAGNQANIPSTISYPGGAPGEYRRGGSAMAGKQPYYIDYETGPGKIGGPMRVNRPGPGAVIGGYEDGPSGPSNASFGGMIPDSAAGLRGSPAIPPVGALPPTDPTDWYSLPDNVRQLMIQNLRLGLPLGGSSYGARTAS